MDTRQQLQLLRSLGPETLARVFFFLLVSCLLEMLVNCTYDIKTNILFLVFNRCYEYHTTFSYNGNQDFTYLKHHHVNCGLNKMIQSIKLERNGPSGDKIATTTDAVKHHVNATIMLKLILLLKMKMGKQTLYIDKILSALMMISSQVSI